MASAYAFGNVTDDSGYSNSTSVLLLHVPHQWLLKIWLCSTIVMSLPDLIEWAGIKAVKQVMGGGNLPDERIGKNAEIVVGPIIKLGKIIILKQKRT